MDIALGLGSNLGDRKRTIMMAIHLLTKENCISRALCSSFLATKALLPDDAPLDWNLEFINCVLIGKTHLSATQLPENIFAIEKQLGRERDKRWQPRTIDIDILLYGDSILSSPTLVVPHYDLLGRDFFLKPLKEIAPHWVFPGPGPYHKMTIKQIVARIYGE